MAGDISSTPSSASPRNLWRSTAAVLAGVIAVVVLSLGTDEMLQVAGVLPQPGEAMPEPALNVLALLYRCAFNIVGAYITAMLAPRRPLRHVQLFALIGFVLGTVGAIVTIPMNLGPAWYPVLLALSSLPSAWLGWIIYKARRSSVRRD
jgi:hypothetical protein